MTATTRHPASSADYVAEEVHFLLGCGEHPERVATALGYGRPNTLLRALQRWEKEHDNEASGVAARALQRAVEDVNWMRSRF